MNSQVAGLGAFQETEALRIALEQNREENDGESVFGAGETKEIDLVEHFGVENELVAAFAQKAELGEDSDDDFELPNEEEEALEEDILIPKNTTQNQEEEEEEPADLGKYISILGNDELVSILLYIDEDSLDQCKLLNRKWRQVLKTERIWQHFCQWIFAPPAFREIKAETRNDKIVPRKFHSWFQAWKRRPRVRVLSGIYILKMMYIKNTGPRSMWTEDYAPICECKHYRYMLFRPDGSVLYSSTPNNYGQMRKHFKKKVYDDVDDGLDNDSLKYSKKSSKHRIKQKVKAQDTTKAHTIFNGCYTVSGSIINVVLNLVHFTVTFALEIDTRDGSHDRLTMINHQSVYHKPGERVIQYDLPANRFERMFWYYPLNTKIYP